jgi:isoleucyl-tRNA synthetase
MSTSQGTALEVEDLLKDFGADVCRWWVVSANIEHDIKVDTEFFQTAGDEYRKVRNTIRFLLANLQDFDPAEHRRPLTEADAHSLDAWAHAELRRVIRDVRRHYEGFDFRRVHEAVRTATAAGARRRCCIRSRIR